MSWFPSFALNSSGQVQAVTSGAVTSTIGAQGYVGSSPLVSTDAVDSSDTSSAGVRYSAGGALRVYDATSGLPATSYSIGGFKVTPSGQLCITTDSVGGDVIYVQGVACTNDGRVYVNG